MARAGTKKAKPNDSPGAAGGKSNGSILSFFARTPSDHAAAANGTGKNGHGNAAAAALSGMGVIDIDQDVKPTLSKSGRKVSTGSRKGKEKAGAPGPPPRGDSGLGAGSVDDPMVISDEEDAIECVSPPASTKATSAVTGDEPNGFKGDRRVKMPQGQTDFGAFDIDVIDSHDEPGPSKPRSRSRSPPPAIPTNDGTEQSCSPPPPFAGMPNFQPPATWPEIVNTASVDDDDMGLDGDGAYSRKLEQYGDDEISGQQDNDDDDSVADRSDGSHNEDQDDSHDPSDAPDALPEPIPAEQPDPDTDADIVDMTDHDPIPGHTTKTADPIDTVQTNFAGLDMDMEWGDDAEEGMGMDDFGEEEGLDVDDPADGVLGKRKDKIAGKGSKGGAGGKKGKDEGAVEGCPVCGKTMKGKSDAIVQKHINTCLDNPSPSTSKIKKPAKTRPISSFAPASPAPSPSPSPPPDHPTKSSGPNAFSVLMSGHKEREQWKDAEIDLKRDGKRTFGRRKAPFYKVMTGMPVAVDAFRYGAIPKVTAYLLTHAHSDHYTNLSKSWTHGPIYCSQTTANLIVHMLGVEPQWVHGLPDDVPFIMPNTGGVKVTPIEANHCPGSSIFLFEGPQTVNAGDSGFKSPYVGSKRIFRYLHCGDFRACPKMVLHPDIARARIDTCYLDTTYLNPKYCFPPQPQVIEACAQLARKTVLGLPDDAPSLRDVKPPVWGLIKAEGHAVKREMGGGGGGGIEGKEEEGGEEKPDMEAINYEPGLAEIQAEERGKAMMKGWLVNVKEEDVKMEEGGEGLVKREEGEELVDVKPELGGHGDKSQANGAGATPKKKGRTLVVMGTYSIGKERIVKAVAQALGTTIYCDPRKRGILLCETDPDLHALLSTDPISSHVHLLPLGNIQLDRMQEYLVRLHPHFDRVLGFRPTGWSYSPPAGTDMMPDVNAVIRRDQARWFTDASLKPMRGSCRQYMMYGVPYSEHSSFFELSCFALSMPGPDLRMIATVNVGNEKSRAKMKKWFEKWLAEKARRKEKNLPAVVDYRDITYSWTDIEVVIPDPDDWG